MSNTSVQRLRKKHISKCGGGAVALRGGLAQTEHGEIVITNVSSTGSGGGVMTPMVVSHGKLSIQAAVAANRGGCLMIDPRVYAAYITHKGTKLGRLVADMQISASRKMGLGLQRRNIHRGVTRTTFLIGDNMFDNCRADQGGGVFSRGLVRLGKVSFSNCFAESIQGGAAMMARSVQITSFFEVTNCTTPKGGVFAVKEDFWTSNATFRNSSSPQVVAGEGLTAHHVVLTGSSGAALMGKLRQIEALECDNGFEGYVDRLGTGCGKCRNGYYQLQGPPKILNGTVFGHECIKVPQQTAEVSAGCVRMRPGYMVEASNASISLHCPNEMACPGGQITTSGFVDMCEKGYEGLGCVDCASTHGRGSSDPFTCTRCSTSKLGKVTQWTVYILEQTIVFAISASGVICAGAESYESTIYSNQLMSYVLVSLPVLRQLQNSKSFKALALYVQDVIEAFSIPVDVANGLGSEGQSAECLLDYLGVSKTLYGGDAIFLVLALSLMVVLAVVVDVWSSMVVAGNCYLPRLCFGLGRHLSCYRLHSEAHGDALTCGFKGDVGIPVPVTIVLLAVAFVGGSGSWIWLIRRREQIASPGVAYLIQPYKEKCQNWEVTVLVRKVLLAVVCAVYPSSFNAVMQLELIGVIILVSLVITLQRSPYVSQDHNRTESRLLVLALLMVLATFGFQANEHSWTRTETTQKVTLIFIVTLATGPAIVMCVRIVRALVEEFRALAEGSEGASPKADSAQKAGAAAT